MAFLVRRRAHTKFWVGNEDDQMRGQSAGAEDALWGLVCPCGRGRGHGLAKVDLGALQPLVLSIISHVFVMLKSTSCEVSL